MIIKINKKQAGKLIAKKLKELNIDKSIIDDLVSNISEAIDTSAAIHYLAEKYIENCGISLGYRTAIWDTMADILTYSYKEFNYTKIASKLEKILDKIDISHTKYDVTYLEKNNTVSLILNLYTEEENAEKKSFLTLGILALSDTEKYIEEYYYD